MILFLHLEEVYGKNITYLEMRESVKFMFDEENEDGLEAIAEIVDLMEMMVLMRGAQSSFLMYDTNDDLVLDVEELADSPLKLALQEWKSAKDEPWDFEEYFAYINANSEEKW